MTTPRPRDTRERILAAAAAIIAEEGVTARMTVRAVATRAGVSIGSMRHHFPTQQALRDQVLERVGGWVSSAESMADTSLPGRERLLRALREVLLQIGTGQHARAAMITTITTFVAVEQTPQVRRAYFAVEQDGQRRIERWLESLVDDGLLPREDVPRSARFLGIVLNGLALQRALPAADGLTHAEEQTLDVAVSAVLADEASRTAARPPCDGSAHP